MSTISSSNIFLSRSASNTAVADANAAAMSVLASPIILPKLAFSSGDIEPKALDARATGDLSPA